MNTFISTEYKKTLIDLERFQILNIITHNTVIVFNIKKIDLLVGIQWFLG